MREAFGSPRTSSIARTDWGKTRSTARRPSSRSGAAGRLHSRVVVGGKPCLSHTEVVRRRDSKQVSSRAVAETRPLRGYPADAGLDGQHQPVTFGALRRTPGHERRERLERVAARRYGGFR